MKRIALLLCVLAASGLTPVHAKVSDASSFGRLPVLEAGRVMPLDTYARMRLLQLSGKSTFDRQPAIHWLTRLSFTPDQCQEDRVFLVNNPEVLEAIDVARVKESRDRYSFQQLQPAMDKLREKARQAAQVAEAERSPYERELLQLYHNVNTYLSLMYACRFAIPDADFTVTNAYVLQKLQLPADRTTFTFLDIYLHASNGAAELESFTRSPPATWTPDQQALYALSARLFQWSQQNRDMPMALLPVRHHGESTWLSPWDAIGMRSADEDTRADLLRLQEMAAAYAAGRQVDFDMAAHAIDRSVRKRAGDERGVRRIDLELSYNRLDLFYRAEMLYGLAFLAALIAVLLDRRGWRRAALALVFLALLPHTVGLVSRMLIMGRPPVTNLYATFVFVAWICALLGLAVEGFQRNALGTLLAAVGGLGLLLVSGRFNDSGDSMGVMIAVLDSNFWLATHVVAISIGYAGCVAAGLAGHLYLLMALRRHPEHEGQRALARAVYGLLAFGLVFSFLGTMLGGVWADQSWGRFWGWDPKENGALLIVLWCAIIFHARIGKWIGDRGTAAGSVLGVIVVLMAWLGINLLGVGLHSYGFTSGLALGFWSTVAIELLFVAAVLPFTKKPAIPHQVVLTNGTESA